MVPVAAAADNPIVSDPRLPRPRAPSRPPLRVLLADDHGAVRAAIKERLEANGDIEVVAEASDGVEALQLAETTAPAIAVLDLSMPRCSGLEATRQLAVRCPHVKVVALTRETDPAMVAALLDAGAVGYMLKQSPSTELIHALRIVAAGGRYVDASVPAAPSTHLVPAGVRKSPDRR